MSATTASKKMSSSAFSQYVMSLDDLYEMAQRNGYFLPKRSSSAINELMLFNVLQGNYWCPKYKDVRMLPCVKPPLNEILMEKGMKEA